MVFALSLAHGRWQQVTCMRHDEFNKTMSDYAIRIKGLRKDLTDESYLSHQLQTVFMKAISEDTQLQSLPLEDQALQRSGVRAVRVHHGGGGV